MAFSPKEKRKNDGPRRFPWWLLAVGFLLGVIATLIVIQLNLQSDGGGLVSDFPPGALEQTATAIIIQVTQQALGPSASVDDPALLTITAIIAQATEQLLGTPAVVDDPMLLTATAIILDATAAAAAP